jgi:heme o synthase
VGNPKSNIQNLKFFALLAAILTYCLVVVGNIVRITESGLGCPDWPLCYGTFVVWNTTAVIEMAHRAFAGLVSILVVAIAVLIFRQKPSKTLVRLSVLTLVLLAAQILLGALTVWMLLHAAIVALHLAAGMALLGCMVAMTLLLRAPSVEPAAMRIPADRRPAIKFQRFTIITAVAVYILLVTGGLVSGNGAALACNMSFPLCNGQWLPNGGSLVLVNWLHRATVFFVSLLVLRVVWRAWVVARLQDPRTARLLRVMALALGGGFLLQATIGASMVLLGRPSLIATLHNAVAAFVWVSALSLALLANRLPVTLPAPVVKPLPAWRQTLADYVALTKPRVLSLLLLTTLAGMFVTPAGPPPFYLVVWTLIGGYLMAGGANAINMAYDVDIDTLMGRTKLRPVVSGRISSRNAFIFGAVLALVAFLILVLFVNVLAACLSLLGFVYYTVIYTRWLKRSTWQNIVIGGGAGAIPPLVGWAAAYGQLTWAALFLFVIVFYWTPPHFWALALLKQKDYALAGVPMLPVVAGDVETARQMWLYSWGMVVLSLVLVPLQAMGPLYLVCAVGLGAIFLWRAWRVNHEHTPLSARSLYKYSLLYLALLFCAMVLDRMAVRM